MQQKTILLSNQETYAYFEQGDCKDTLVLLHGNTSSSIFFEPLLQMLPKSIRVIAPDLRGFGNSSYSHPIETLTDFADDLKMFLDQLHIRNIQLLGWSLGGNIAMEFASKYPDMVSHLILLSSGSLKGYPVFKKNELGHPVLGSIYASKEELSKDPVQVLPLINAYHTGSVEFMEYIYDLAIYNVKKPDKEMNRKWMKEAIKQRNLVDVDWALANQNLSNEPSFYQQGNHKISSISARILNIWGDKDLTVPKYMFDENQKHLKDSEALVFTNCGHSILIDDCEKLAIEILNFIK